MSIDRPDISNLPTTVGVGHYQFEIGAEYSENTHTSAANLPNFLLRTGLGNKTELRVGASITRLDSMQGGFSDHFSSLSLSVKHRIVQENGWIPAIGLQPEVNVIRSNPTEATATSDLTYDMLVLFNSIFHEQIFLNYNLGWFYFSEHEHRWLLSASLSFQHTHRLGYFAEVYTIRTWEEERNLSYDIGITFLINPRLQIDLYAGKLWTTSSAIQYIGSGIGFRLDRGDVRHRTFKEIGIHH